jgi:hypothetical protein
VVPARALVVAFALLACAWFALGARQARDVNVATNILSQPTPLRPAQARQVASLLHSAGTLNPDRLLDVLRGELASAEGQNARARQILIGVIHQEPKYLRAWVAYATASRDDQAAFDAAVVGARRLDPLAR